MTSLTLPASSPISTTPSPGAPKHKHESPVHPHKEKEGCCFGRRYKNIFPSDNRLVRTRPIFQGDD